LHFIAIHPYILIISILNTKMTCKGICVRYKAQKPVGTGRYASGQRRCQICEIFIKWEGLWCPCCGYRLRTKPRNLKYKAKLRARVEADSIEAQAREVSRIALEVEVVAKVKPKTKAKLKTKVKSTKVKPKTKAKLKTKVKLTKVKLTKVKLTKVKSTKSKERIPCKYCEKLYLFVHTHEAKCKKKLQNHGASLESESIAIKA